MDLQEIRKQITEKPRNMDMPVKVVAIDGHGGSGKSTLAKKLASLLDAEIIQTDDFASWDNPLDWWPRLRSECLEPIKNNARTISYNRSSWAPDHHPEPAVDQPVTDIIILEGVSSSRKEFRPYLSFAIWVETPVELCFKRGMERDGESARENWERGLKNENDYIERDNPLAYADIVVSGVK